MKRRTEESDMFYVLDINRWVGVYIHNRELGLNVPSWNKRSSS